MAQCLVRLGAKDMTSVDLTLSITTWVCNLFSSSGAEMISTQSRYTQKFDHSVALSVVSAPIEPGLDVQKYLKPKYGVNKL